MEHSKHAKATPRHCVALRRLTVNDDHELLIVGLDEKTPKWQGEITLDRRDFGIWGVPVSATAGTSGPFEVGISVALTTPHKVAARLGLITHGVTISETGHLGNKKALPSHTRLLAALWL